MGVESKQLFEGSGEDASPSDYFEIPPGWTWSTLGDAAVFINGDRSANYPKQSDFVSHGVAFVNTGHIEPTGKLSVDRMDYISRECFERLRSGKLMKGDIVYCLRGSTIGKTARVDLSEGSVASSLVIIRAKSKVSQEYLYYFLISPLGQSFVRQHDNGSAQPNLSVSAISRYPIPIPPLAEQKAIAAVLGALDDKIELNQRMNATLEVMARALFRSWFVDFDPVRAKLDGPKPVELDSATAALFPAGFQYSTGGHIPKGWEVSTIGAKLSTVLGGTPSRAKPEYWTDGTVAWINSGKTNEFRITEPSEWITKEALENSATKVLPRRTTVLAITGATLGQVSIAEIECCANQSVVAIPASEQFPTEFIYPWIEENIQMLIASQTGGAQQHINKGNVDELALLCPNHQVMTAYQTMAKPLFDRIAANCFQSRTLATMRDTLLPKLLSGELKAAG